MAIPLLAIGMGISAAAGIAQSIQGIGQVSKSRKEMENLTKPEYIIPQEIAQNLTDAEQRQYYGLPDAQKREFLNSMQQSTTDALRSSATRRGGLQMVSNIQEQQNQMSNQLMLQDIQAREAKVGQLMDARREMAQQRLQKFAHEYSDYSSQLDYLRSQESAGIQNIFGGVDQLASTAINAGTMQSLGGFEEGGLKNLMQQGGGENTSNTLLTKMLLNQQKQDSRFSLDNIIERQGMTINPLTGLPY